LAASSRGAIRQIVAAQTALLPTVFDLDQAFPKRGPPRLRPDRPVTWIDLD